MNKISASVLCVLLSVLSAGAFAEAISFDAAGLEVMVPAGWNMAKDGATMSITAPDKEMAIVFLVLPQAAADKAIEAIEKELDKAVGKIKWDKTATKDKIGGMEAEVWEGTAQDGKLQVEAIYVDLPGDKNTLGIFWFDTPESEKKYAKEIEVIVKGIKKK